MPSPTDAIESQRSRPAGPAGVGDDVLIARACGGDEAALRALMTRYNRLVRFTVFKTARDRCRRDPNWLDTVAADAWVGFVQSIRRTSETPDAVAAYLVRIARNKAVSALRSATREEAHVDDAADPVDHGGDESGDPVLLISGLEEIEALKGCLELLDEDDRHLATQLSAIIERRWRDAAAALGLAESTVRSRWKRVLDRLRACLEQKTGQDFAPPGPPDDK